jgi:2-hydroxycyclohexanecarboxyl-CoA dehydrogenase
MAMGLSGKNAVITGGASGIGRAICLRLARDGAGVAIFDINEEGADETAEEVRGLGGRALPIITDVADSLSVRRAVECLHAQLGPADILVNDAGIGQFALLAEMTEEQWDRMIAVHLKGTFNCTRALVPDMIQSGWGRVVNIASVAGLSGGGPGLSHYAAAKGGIVAFTKALAHELGPSGITVNAIAPGLIDTPMIRQGIVSGDIFEVAVEGAPVRRIGAPDDIAAACAYLVSPEAAFFTGQVMSPNGGRFM